MMGEKTVSSSLYLHTLTFFAVIGGLLFGYNSGIISGAMLLIAPQFQLSTVWQEVIVSGTIVSAAVASLCTNFPLDWVGRRCTILVSDVVFVMGGVVMGAAVNKEMLLVGRIVVGVAIGMTSVAVPVYIAECSPTEVRGRMVTFNQLTITLGILLSSVVCGAINELTSDHLGWRLILSVEVILAIIQFIAFLFLPESPRWLVDKDRIDDACSVLQKIRATDDVKLEILCVFTDRLRKLVTGLSVKSCALTIGTILKMAGFPVRSAIWLVVVPNGVNFLSTFIGLWAVERYGRRVLIISSIIGMSLACVVLATGFHLSAAYSPPINSAITEVDINGTLVQPCNTQYTSCDSCVTNTNCGFCFDDVTNGTCLPAAGDTGSTSGRCMRPDMRSEMTWTYGYCPNDYYWISIFGMVAFEFAFAPGLGPMPWTINSELYPLWARSTCNSITTATLWLCNVVVAFTFLTLTQTITKYGTFWMYAGLCLIGGIVFYVFLPETKDKTLEDVEELFMTEEEKREKRKSASVEHNPEEIVIKTDSVPVTRL